MSFRRSFVLAAALLIGACAAKQHVTLDCLPEDVTIFVDGRRLESNPDSVELESDKPHTVLFRAPADDFGPGNSRAVYGDLIGTHLQ